MLKVSVVTELEKLVAIGVELGLTGAELRSWLERERAELSAIRAAEWKPGLRDLENEQAELRQQLSDLPLASAESRAQENCCVQDSEVWQNIEKSEKTC